MAGIVLVASGASDVGAALVLAGCGSMAAAAIVLLDTSRCHVRAAAAQGLIPTVAVVLMVGSLLAG